jgi:hypothetical protein
MLEKLLSLPELGLRIGIIRGLLGKRRETKEKTGQQNSILHWNFFKRLPGPPARSSSRNVLKFLLILPFTKHRSKQVWITGTFNISLEL